MSFVTGEVTCPVCGGHNFELLGVHLGMIDANYIRLACVTMGTHNRHKFEIMLHENLWMVDQKLVKDILEKWVEDDE